MFTVHVWILSGCIAGLKALDERRRLKMPDGTILYLSTNRKDWGELQVPVSEGFARRFFEPEQTMKKVDIEAKDLEPGDVQLMIDTTLAWADNISEARKQEIALFACSG